jgi:hypothetical protein
VMSSRTVIVPPVRKTTMRRPDASAQALKLPLPELLRLVTSQTYPPRPPSDDAPKPSAVGNALTSPSVGGCIPAGVGRSGSRPPPTRYRAPADRVKRAATPTNNTEPFKSFPHRSSQHWRRCRLSSRSSSAKSRESAERNIFDAYSSPTNRSRDTDSSTPAPPRLCEQGR